MSAPTASREVELLGESAHPDHEPEHGEQEELELEARRAAGRSRHASQRDAATEAPTKTRAVRLTVSGRFDAPSARGDETEHRGDHDVLEDEDRQHEIGLVVGEAPEVDERLDRDRARRDVDARRDHDRSEGEAERGDPHEQARSAPLTTRSMVPPSPTWRPLRTSRSTLNSRPRKNRRKMSPISAANAVTSEGWTRLRIFGSFGPSRMPASR